MRPLVARYHFARAIRGHWAFGVVAFVWTIFSNFTKVRDNFFPPALQQKFSILNFIPKWPWHVWVIGLLLILLVMVFEGAYSVHNKKEESALAKSAPGVHIPPKTNLVFLRARVAWISISVSNCGGIFQEEQNKRDVRGIIACFRNEPSVSRRVIDAEYVQAQIVYHNHQGQEIGDVSSPCWLDHDFDMIDFPVGGQSRCVLIGLLDDGGKLVAPWKRRERTGHGDSISRREQVFDGVASMVVRLIGRNNDLLLAPFVLDLSIANNEPHIAVRPQQPA
jgi:hypothetical protein